MGGYYVNQGKHDPNAGEFSVIESKRELVKIYKIGDHKHFENSMRLDMRIISDGPNKNKTFNDGVPYVSSDPFAWKYIALRKAAGVPYLQGEPSEIDLEELLLNKVVAVELTSALDKKDPTIKRQRVKYLPLTNADIAQLNQAAANASAQAPQPTETVPTPQPNNTIPPIEVEEDDLPF